jgi:heat shock protein HtpX
MSSASGAAGFVVHQRINRRATVVVLGGTMVLLLAAFSAIAAVVGGYSSTTCTPDGFGGELCTHAFTARPGVLAATVIVVGLYMLVAYLASGSAALALSRARPADGPEYAGLRDTVEQMAIAAGVPQPKVYVVHDPAPNAFATGRNPRHAAVTVTTGLLGQLSHRELRGVVAHEVAHIKNRDIAITTLAVLAVGTIAMLAQVTLRVGVVVADAGDDSPVGALGGTMALVGLALFVLALPAGLLLKAALSRTREALADATAIELTREPAGLRGALEKLEADTTVVSKASPAVAHLWIESPLERGQTKGITGRVGRMFDTHPPLADRIAALRGYEGLDPTERGPIDPCPDGLDPATRAAARSQMRSGPGPGRAPLIPGAGEAQVPLPLQGQPHPAVTPNPAGWFHDPTGAYELRWWDGHHWSDHASNGGAVVHSPLPPGTGPLA